MFSLAPIRSSFARKTVAAAWPWAAMFLRWVLGGVFIAAGLLKLLDDPAAAIRGVRAYQLLPEALVAPVAFGLPVLEVAVGLALITGVFVRLAASGTALMLIAFLIGIVSAWSRGLQVDCGCFGTGEPTDDPGYLAEIIRDVLLLVAAGLLTRWPRSRLALGAWLTRPVAQPNPEK